MGRCSRCFCLHVHPVISAVLGTGIYYPLFLWLSRTGDKFSELEPPIQVRIVSYLSIAYWVRPARIHACSRCALCIRAV